MNFVYEPLQFDRLTKLVEFNTLLCTDTIKKELGDAVMRKKQYTPKMSDLVQIVKRVSSFHKNISGRDLKLKVSEENKRRLKDYAWRNRGPDRQASRDSSDSEYADALEELPNESAHL